MESFIASLGYEPVLSEKGNIPYDPDISLDESCYRVVSEATIFVLIIGGRYGSAASDTQMNSQTDFFDQYESITKKEYETAAKIEIPTYILVERSVYCEYETYKKNRSNESIDYVHIDSINVFHMLDQILAKQKNNPLYQFDRYSEIEAWLREQWAGLFRELINRRSSQKQLTTLSEKVDELAGINGTLKRYLENIVSKVSSSPDEADDIIKKVQENELEIKRRHEFSRKTIVSGLLDHPTAIIGLDDIITLFTEAKSVLDLAERIENFIPDEKPGGLTQFWKGREDDILEKVNDARDALGLSIIPFK